MRAHHESLPDLDSGSIARRNQLLSFSHRHAERLFAQNMFAGFGGLNRPGNMQMVGKGIVDGINFRIS
jgi:hypothetical protein